jgi:phytoene synthase
MQALYAFMRHTDDLADNPRPAEQRAEALRQWRAAFDRKLADARGGPVRMSDLRAPAETAFEQVARDGRALLPALVDTVRQFQIPPEHFHAVIDGVEMDLVPRRYQTFADLEPYCQRVASAVGLACVYVWGFRGPEALAPARKCGLALQLTNILRDLGEDARQDRVYLPLTDLRRCDYSVDDLLRGVADHRFRRLMRLQFDRAERFYREGTGLFDWLRPDGRRIFGTIMSTYHALLKRIMRRPQDVLRRRISVPAAQRLQIAVRWMLLPPRTAAML